MLERAKGKGYENIDKLLLVGGSSYMPQVIEQVKATFPFEVRIYDPNQAVAKGAAIFGYKCQLEDQIKFRVAEETGQSKDAIDLDMVSDEIKDEAARKVAQDFGLALPGLKKLGDLRITNVTSKSFGLVVMDTARGIEGVNNLIVIDDKVPCQITRQFGTYEDNQSQADLRLMENQERHCRAKILAPATKKLAGRNHFYLKP
jgi:molecular chaperone DnaK (HSP70)